MARLLNVKQASEELGVRVATIRSWLLKRKLPHVKCGRAVRIPSEAIEEFVRRNTIPAREIRQ